MQSVMTKLRSELRRKDEFIATLGDELRSPGGRRPPVDAVFACPDKTEVNNVTLVDHSNGEALGAGARWRHPRNAE